MREPATVRGRRAARRARSLTRPQPVLSKLLWRRRRRILLRVSPACIAALLFGQFAPARYTAFVQVLVDPNDLRVVDNVLRGQNQFTETHVTQVENQVRVLMSNNVARRVVERLKLDRDPDFIGRAHLVRSGAAIRALVRQPADGPGRSRARSAHRAQGAHPLQARRPHLCGRRQRLGATTRTRRSRSPMRCWIRSWRSSRPRAPKRRAAPPAR